jgi:hypothetical protein
MGMGARRHTSQCSMVAVTPGLETILGKICERYSHPSRVAYLYLFHLVNSADRGVLIPNASEVLQAWIDEGSGLALTDPQNGIAQCQATANFRTSHPANTHERRMSMARVVTLTVTQDSAVQYSVNLISRALHFSPKGDRQAFETWRPAEGSWYSAPVGRE